jgi:GTP cyclohydrolase I
MTVTSQTTTVTTADQLAEFGVRSLLQYVGEDPDRPGLGDTPRRVLGAYAELTAGYARDPAEVLAAQFDQDVPPPYQGIVVLVGVPFVSVCEHHLMPFTGTATVAYAPQPDPGARLVGLSKLARLVDVFALRLQVQERITVQIVEALVEHLKPRGAACILRAEHSCMAHRGARKSGGTMVTSELRGIFFDDLRAREEFMALAREG